MDVVPLVERALPEGAPALAEPGADRQEDEPVGLGELIIRKETMKYSGYDFEGEKIHDNLLKLEKSKTDELEDANLDPEEIEERARLNCLKDKAERQKTKNSR